jgi:hypothetical protein
VNDDAESSPVAAPTAEADDPSPASSKTGEPAAEATAPTTDEPGSEPDGEADPGPAIPRQRVPVHDVLPSPPAPPAPRRRTRRTLLAAAAVVVLGAAAAYAFVPGTPAYHGLLSAAPAAAATPPTPPSPYDLAVKALSDQAAALLRHDHAGWMAAVDPAQPALRKHFEQLYSTLQALHVTHFEYHSSLGGLLTGPVLLNTNMAFCLSAATCPDYVGADDYDGPPTIAEKLTLKLAGGRWMITKLAKAEYPSSLEPYPWEAGPLVYKQGKRVTVAAPRSLAGKLSSVLAVADKAALTDDRFAVLMKNPQLRYRVFLADDKAWKTWYGGGIARYAVAYTIPTDASGSDVVLHMSQLRAADLKVVVQHEMGHVATLSNLTTGDDNDMWLKEGVADYIGWLPQHTRQDWDFPAARDALHSSHPPKTIDEPPLKDSASDRAANRFYGLAHFAVECLAAKYGQGRAMNFVRLKLRADDDLDTAAQQAFGTSFSAVDKGCVSWMKQHS